MGYIATRDESVEKIARIMSERTGYEVSASDVKRELDRVTTSIFSAIIYDRPGDRLSPATSILCTVRKWGCKENRYEVTVERLGRDE